MPGKTACEGLGTVDLNNVVCGGISSSKRDLDVSRQESCYFYVAVLGTGGSCFPSELVIRTAQLLGQGIVVVVVVVVLCQDGDQ